MELNAREDFYHDSCIAIIFQKKNKHERSHHG